MLRKQQVQLTTRAADSFQQVLIASAKGAGTGAATRDVHADGPFIHAQLTPAVLRAVAWDSRISYIGLDREEGVHDSGPTIPASLPQSCTDSVLNTGARGAGVRIAMIDLAGVPSLSSNCFRIAAQQTTGGGTNQHVDFMMGLIGNRYGTGNCSSVNTWEGYGYDSSILLANDSSYSNAYSWARNYSSGGVVGANIVSMSFHLSGELTNPNLTARDIYFDYWTTHSPYPTVFTSSGNGGTASGGDYANGKGYNIISVGNVYNVGDPHRCDDAIASSSAWLDPPNTDREVPTIAIPGSDHNLLYGTSNGTSASTAIAAGIAADVMSENTALKSWPEAVRAILLASANYELSDSNYFSQNADGKDGGGEVNSYYAYELSYSRANGTAAPYGHDYGTATTSSFTDGLFNQTWQIRKDPNADQHQSQRMRFAIAWDSNTTTSSSTLDLDLDIDVLDPNGNNVATSNSYGNSWELVDFPATMSGNYTLRIVGYSVPQGLSRYWGVAWFAYPEHGRVLNYCN